jgi:alanine racemase
MSILKPKFETLNTIHLNSNALLSNIELVHKLSGYKVIPVLKSNAYGHGIEQVAKILNGSNCEMIAVDSYFEANKIKKIFKGKILILGYISPKNARLLTTKRISYVIQDITSLKAFAKTRKPVNIHIELNTGMNRLGLVESEIEPYIKIFKKYKKLHLEGIMTHLADADNKSSTFTDKQVEKFDALTRIILDQGFRPEYIHISQTAGSLKVNSRYANTVRLGIGTYGINPLTRGDKYFEKLKKLQPVLELKSTIIKTIDLEKGEKVGYGCTFTAKKNTKIAVLPLGYYEAIPRELSNKGVVTYEKGSLPIVGRVCMNHTMIDITGTSLKAGDKVTIISSKKTDPNSILSVQSKFKLFSYELLSNLSDTIRRQIA